MPQQPTERSLTVRQCARATHLLFPTSAQRQALKTMSSAEQTPKANRIFGTKLSAAVNGTTLTAHGTILSLKTKTKNFCGMIISLCRMKR